MAQRDLKLNSLGRYGKDSSRLILEEHGHCEIPAGCGGAVLRWRNPNTGLLFLFEIFATAKCEVFLDGAPLSSARPLIGFGDHVISLVLSEITTGGTVIGFRAIHDESQFGFPQVSRPSGRIIQFSTNDESSWKYSATEPADASWMRGGFDDSGWAEMSTCAPPVLEEKDMRSYRLRALTKAGIHCLGIDRTAGSRVWIRRSFRIEQNAR